MEAITMGILNRLFGKENGGDAKKETTMITFTETAQEKIRAIIESKGAQIQGLRVGAEAPGQYSMSLDESAPSDSDTVLQVDGFQVFVDAHSAPWLQGSTVDFIEDLMGGGFKIDNPNDPKPEPRSRPEPPTEGPDAEIWKKVSDILETMINPAVAGHGGQIELIDVKEGRVFIEMLGGCQGCGMSRITLKQGIERAIMEEVPEVVEILDVTDHASGTNPYYRA
jgi:Fe/S biogenesis protein NfuA